jgi:hypothetical protein
MAKNGKATAQGREEVPAEANKDPRSLTIAEKGIKTGHDFANFMSAMMSDLIDGRVTPSIGNAACNAGGKLLKVVEMQYKYGTQAGNGGKRTLVLAVEEARDNVAQIEPPK